jgi:hypothetical protein
MQEAPGLLNPPIFNLFFVQCQVPLSNTRDTEQNLLACPLTYMAALAVLQAANL